MVMSWIWTGMVLISLLGALMTAAEMPLPVPPYREPRPASPLRFPWRGLFVCGQASAR